MSTSRLQNTFPNEKWISEYCGPKLWVSQKSVAFGGTAVNHTRVLPFLAMENLWESAKESAISLRNFDSEQMVAQVWLKLMNPIIGRFNAIHYYLQMDHCLSARYIFDHIIGTIFLTHKMNKQHQSHEQFALICNTNPSLCVWYSMWVMGMQLMHL